MNGRIIAGDYAGSGLEGVFINCRAFRISIRGCVQSVELVSEENKKKFIGAAGWGLAGAVALGPLGLIAGALAGGNKKEVCFACYLIDGKKFMAVADAQTYQVLTAEAWRRSAYTDTGDSQPSCDHLFCTKCGTKMGRSDRFCNSCGEQVAPSLT